MVRVPMFYLDEVITDAPHQLHPMFKINGKKYRCIYISKYQNVVINDGTKRAYSLPAQCPTTNINFDDAYEVCKNKGKGWHLITNAEWAGIALWCKANGFQPKGNNNYGKDVDETVMKAEPATYGTDGKVNLVKTGTGPASWYHDNTYAGIADLNGNIWEWCSGAKLNNGEINIIKDNDAADTTLIEDWKAINSEGTLVELGTDNTCEYSIAYNGNKFSTITTEPEAAGSGAMLLESLCLLPHAKAQSSDYGEDAVWITLKGEHVPHRGGYFPHGALYGVFALYLNNARAYSSHSLGFRAAYFDEADQDDNIPESEAV